MKRVRHSTSAASSANASSASGAPGGEGGGDEAGTAPALGGQLGERVLGERVAVDAHEQPGGAETLGDEAAVAAGADRAVDGALARLRVQRLDQLPGEDGDVRAWHVKQDGQERK